MKLKEISYTYRVTMPGSQYDYEVIAATAEVSDKDDVNEAYSKLREHVITQSTKYKKKEKADGNTE